MEKLSKMIKKHKNIRMVNTEEKLNTYTIKHTFRSAMEIYMLLIHLMKELVELKRPIYIGQAVLDISKFLIYELYYEQILGYSQDLCGHISILGGTKSTSSPSQVSHEHPPSR